MSRSTAVVEAAANDYVSGAYAKRHPTWHAEDSRWKARHILALLRAHDLEPQLVCDVGCGAGEVLRELQPALGETAELVGFDISPQAIALARERANDHLRFRCEDFLSASTERFDLLLAVDVFEHVEDYLGFLKALRGRAAHKIFHIPLDLSVQSVLRSRPLLEGRQQFGHLHYFTQQTALATLGDCGYQIIDWRYAAAALDCPRRLRTRLTNLPRRVLAAFSRDLAARLLGGYSLLVLSR